SAIGRLIIAENDLRPARQRRNTANGILNVSFLVFAWNDYGYGKVIQGNGWRNHSRHDNLRHAELAQKWQACTKMIQKTRQQWQIFRQKNNSMRLESFKTRQLQQIPNIGGGKQFCSVRGTFIPVHSAKVTSGSQR